MARVGPKRPMFASRRRRRRLVPLITVLAALVAVPAVATVLAGSSPPPAAAFEADGDSGVVPAADAVAAAHTDPGAEPAVELPAVFARYQDLQLHLPSEATILVGFHEASQSAALALAPVGHLLDNENTTRFSAPADTEGPDYVVLSSRGRRPPATSAVDLLLHDDDRVLAPVSGRVTDVRSYYLYGKYPDHRIEIAPDDRPDLRLVLIHVTDVQVVAGQRVEAGASVLARPNRFDFGSHIDRYTDPDRWPHVHMELKDPAAG